MSVSTLLKGNELFQSLTFEEVDAISNFSGVKDFQRDENVFASGAAGSHFFVLQEGRINLRLPAEAHEASLVVMRLSKGDIFGLAPLLRTGNHRTTAQCATDCKVLAVEAEPLRALLDQNLVAGLHIMRLVARMYFVRYVETLSGVQKAINDIAAI